MTARLISRLRGSVSPIATRRPRYFIYARFSHPKQANGSSEERQVNMDWHRKEAERLGADLVDVAYIDRGKSGFYGDHLEAAFGQIFEDIESGTIQPGDYLYAESQSRLGRLTPLQAIRKYSDILEAGIILKIGETLRTWESANGTEGLGTLMQDFLDMFLAHRHSTQLQKTLRDTNRIKRDQVRRGDMKSGMKKGGPGWSVGHRCPPWLYPLGTPTLYVDGREYMYAINDSVASVVRMIFEWADDGIGSETIARRLNARKIVPLGQHYRVNKPIKNGWSSGSVLHLLKNRAILGEYQPHTRADRAKVKDGEPEPHYYPPLFPDDPHMFSRVARGIAERNRAGGKGRNGDGQTYSNIVKGIPVCECCEGRVTIKTYPPTRKNRKGEVVPRKGALQYHRCENARRGVILQSGPMAGRRCDNVHGFPLPQFERLLFSLFSPAMLPVLADMLPQRHRNDVLARRLADMDEKLDSIEKRIKRAARLAIDASNDELADQYNIEAKAMQAELGRVRIERDGLHDQMLSHGKSQEEEIAAILTTLSGTAEPETVYDTRVRLHRLLVKYIGVTLHPDHTMTVRIAAHSGLNPVDARLTPGGLASINIVARDGSVLTQFNGAGLALLGPISSNANVAA